MSVPRNGFAALGVPDDLCAVLSRAGIVDPSPVQSAVIGDALAGRDVSGRAPTGSGKTLAFGIPLVVRLTPATRRRPTALVLVPTRELASQIAAALRPLVRRRGHDLVAVYGGVGYGPQRRALEGGAELVVACPGRLEDLLASGRRRARRCRHGRHRRGGSHGRHGLPPGGPTHPRAHPSPAPGPAVQRHVRPCRHRFGLGRAARSGRSPSRCARTGPRQCPPSVLDARADGSSGDDGRRHRRDGFDDRVLPHASRRRPPRQATAATRHVGRGDPRRSFAGPARPRPRRVRPPGGPFADRHRRGGARRARRRCRRRRALRSATRRCCVHPPLGANGACRGQRRRALPRRPGDDRRRATAAAGRRHRRHHHAGPADRPRSVKLAA